MTRMKSYRGRRLASAGVAVALAAGLASGALAAGDAGPQTTDAPRIAVVATVGTPASEIERAATAARDVAGAPGAEATIRRTGGAMDAQAQAAALATGDFAAVAGVGDAGRAAVGQAQSAGIGDDTHWVPVR
jgi:hypothetical protein